MTSLTNHVSGTVNVPSISSIYRTAAIWWCYRECKNVVCCYWKPHALGRILILRNSVTTGNGVWLNHTWHYGRQISSINFRALQIRSDGLEDWNIEFCVLAMGIGLRSGGSVCEEVVRVGHLWNFFLVLLAAWFCKKNVPGGNFITRSVMFCTEQYNC